MKSIVVNLVVVLALLLGGRFVLNVLTAKRLMDHYNACHTELRVEARRSAGDDGVFDELDRCVKDRSNFVDLFFQKKTIEAMIAFMRNKGRY